MDDPDGTELPDDGAARKWALQVIHDLKRNNETAWKGWTIEVTERADKSHGHLPGLQRRAPGLPSSLVRHSPLAFN